MNMLTILKRKSEALQLANTPFLHLLKELMVTGRHPAIWQQTARDLLYKIIGHIAIEEGMKAFSSREDEEKLKEHLPYAISNALDELSHKTLGLANTRMDPATQTTVLFLFFKIVEWFGQNYNNLCIYGEKPDDEGYRMYQTCRNKVDIVAEKDEVWLEMDAICRECGYPGLLENSIYGCKTYSAQALLSIPYNLFFEKTVLQPAPGTRQDLKTNLLVTAFTKTADITSVGIRCDQPEKDTLNHNIYSTLEKNILRFLRKKLEGAA